MLEVKNVSKQVGLFRLKDISFTLKEGYIMGLVGPNGAGKTTLLRVIMNLMKKDAGQIRIFGMEHEQDEKQIKDKIGFVYDENYFHEDFRMKHMSKILSGFYSKWNWDVYRELMEKMQLDEMQKIKTLSKGMKMKYSIVTALCHEAKLILMDEPTAGLDPVVRREVLQLFQAYLAEHSCSLLFSTHITSDLDKIADYITLMQNGEIIFSQSKEDVMNKYILLKGAKEDFSDEIKNLALGWEENSFGFTALTERTSFCSQSIVQEMPILEDLMYFYGRKNNR